MERSFKAEVESLRLGDGQTFHGEGILAVTKALLQSGVSYVGGYQGAPVSHLIDVMLDAKPLLDELGVHLETSTSEAAAAAMLGASINYPLRGAATWKSTVGTNVASDALANLASAGVKGGTLIVIGEDYGEGASIIQERSHAFAMKSQMWLLDPRPNLPTIVNMVERGFELSEVSNTPVMLELRIRACHVYGRFDAKNNRRPQFSRLDVIEKPDFDFNRICLPPATYAQEKHKIEHRMPAAIRFIQQHGLNETFPGETNEIGIVMQGGLYNTVVRALHQVGLADAFGRSRVPLHVLNVTYPIVSEDLAKFCAGKRAVLMVEEGQPDYLEQALNVALRKADLQTKVHGKDVLPMAGEYTSETVLRGLTRFLEKAAPAGLDVARATARVKTIDDHKSKALSLLGGPVPPRPPSFCTGCPERPIFSALKILERDLGPTHISADIGCHTFSTLPPFNLGNTVLGYGMGLASSAGVAPNFKKRVISMMGDGGFWHNGLTNGVASANFNQNDGVLVVVKNGYSSATGWQWLPSSLQSSTGGPDGMTIERALKGVGVKWLKTVYTYNVSKAVKVLKEAMTTAERGLKVIIAEGECMLAKQRRVRAEDAKKIAAGERVAKPKFGVDDQVCTGDHSCIRLSGCPSLSIKENPDKLRRDPVATVIETCVGCGNCGEVSHAAILCPSFYKTEAVHNPGAVERLLDRMRRQVIAWLATPEPEPTPALPGEAHMAAAAE
jgi:indolepyruvate ferredoxin oxidoreductase, alpha subunit